MALHLNRPASLAWSGPGAWWTALAGVLLFAGLLVTSMHVQRFNNGDGWRIFRSAHIQMPDDLFKRRPFPRQIAFQPLATLPYAALVPLSPGAVVVQVVSLSERALRFKQFDFLYVSAVYAALYTAGLLLLARRIGRIFLLPIACLLLNPYLIGYFNAPYEESFFIALTPLLAVFLVDGARTMRPRTRVLVWLTTATKNQFAPLLLLGLAKGKTRANVLYLLLSLLLVSAFVVKTNFFFKDMNGYNRYFNGLAYSMANVSAWPARQFVERTASGAALAQNAAVHFPSGTEPVQRYWGTSYWPTGVELAPDAAALIASHQVSWYWRTVLANPSYLYRLGSEPLLTAWRADYTMDYFFSTGLERAFLRVAAVPMRYFGILYLACVAGAMLVALRRKALRVVLGLLLLLLYPLFVVFGDGYYEYEKHLFPVGLLAIVYSMTYLLQGQERAAHRSAIGGGQRAAGQVAVAPLAG